MKSNFKKNMTKALTPAGFVYKNKIWQRNKGNVQERLMTFQSDYSKTRYIDAGTVYLPLLDPTSPDYLIGHVQTRVAIPKDSRLQRLTDDPDSLPDQEQVEILAQELLPIIEEFFSYFNSEEALREVGKTGVHPKALVMGTLSKWAASDKQH